MPSAGRATPDCIFKRKRIRKNFHWCLVCAGGVDIRRRRGVSLRWGAGGVRCRCALDEEDSSVRSELSEWSGGGQTLNSVYAGSFRLKTDDEGRIRWTGGRMIMAERPS